MAHFTTETFAYFDEAEGNERDRSWFEKHGAEYAVHVAQPFRQLIEEMGAALAHRVPGIEFSARRMSKPLKRNAGLSEGVVRTQARAFFAVSSGSQFEMNPGIYVSLGAGEDDNVLGVGLYQPSSRQMRLLRPRFLSEYQALRKCLRGKDVQEFWGGLAGERYKRFPRGFAEAEPGAEFLWFKQFFLRRHLRRAEMVKSDFGATATAGLRMALPFLEWTREVVGVYRHTTKTP